MFTLSTPFLKATGIIMSVPLVVTALLHLGWAFGMVWPAESEAELVAMVVGMPGNSMPGTILTLFVTTGIGGAALVALWGSGIVRLPLPEVLRRTALGLLAVIFLVRGLAAYLPAGPLAASVEPFRGLDLMYFSPLILFLGAGFALQWQATRKR